MTAVKYMLKFSNHYLSKLTGLEHLACQKGQFTKVSCSNPFYELSYCLLKQ